MQINVSWDDEGQRILRYDFNPEWTWADFQSAKEKGDALVDNTAHQDSVGVLLCLPPGARLPTNAIYGTRNQLMQRHPRAVVVVAVSSNAVLKTFYSIVLKLYPPAVNLYLNTDTVEEGREQIYQRLGIQRPATS